MNKCKNCGIDTKNRVRYSTDYCSRSCAMNKARELRTEYWKVVRLLREKK